MPVIRRPKPGTPDLPPDPEDAAGGPPGAFPVTEHVDLENRTFLIRGRHEVTVGVVLACPNCGREMLVDVSTHDPRGLPKVSASCLECVYFNEESRASLPRTSAAVDAWQAASEANPDARPA